MTSNISSRDESLSGCNMMTKRFTVESMTRLNAFSFISLLSIYLNMLPWWYHKTKWRKASITLDSKFPLKIENTYENEVNSATEHPSPPLSPDKWVEMRLPAAKWPCCGAVVRGGRAVVWCHRHARSDSGLGNKLAGIRLSPGTQNPQQQQKARQWDRGAPGPQQQWGGLWGPHSPWRVSQERRAETLISSSVSSFPLKADTFIKKQPL